MKEKWNFARIISILLILVFFSGCSTMMNVTAYDPNGVVINGAVVHVDGQPAGQTPAASARVSNFIGKTTNIRVEANGFHPNTVEADKEFKIVPFFPGIIPPFWPLLLWTNGPKSQQSIVLLPSR